jgi:DNA-binding HxlR family transcriptional regulator
MEDGTSRSPSHTEVTDRHSPGPHGAASRKAGPHATSVYATETCEIRDLLDRLADKWSLLVVELLGHGTHRFTELRREIDGISQRMLTLTLRQLERDGLVRRTVFPVVPPRVDYCLTPLGDSLLVAVQPLVGWTRAHRDEIAMARDVFDAAAGEQPELLDPATRR